MNRFRTKKKAKEATDGQTRGSTDSDGPSLPPVKTSMPFRLGKKQQQPEPRLELDLANALPSSDNFRTSLLMNGLSARFSMLREQDDPMSKLGKASDDSVLYSNNRQSRLNDFGFQSHGLSDIAEVSSINGSVRPPFLLTRADSYQTTGSNGTDEDYSPGGSVMNRAKPGEGNNLFGGRQKIYKIPAGSPKSLADGVGSGMGGRALYQNDVSQSAFQKQRDKAQQREEAEAEPYEFTRSATPDYNRKRETTSSTTSSAGPSVARSSTAATSVTSQGTPSLSGAHTPLSPRVSGSGNPSMEKPVAKGRRLYETGLDQHLHEQQYSAMSRIDILTRQRALGSQTPPPGHSSPTGFSQQGDKWDRNHITSKVSMPNMRTASPSPTMVTMGHYDLPARSSRPSEVKPTSVVPLSPAISESEDPAVLAVQPNDRGKATALGTFSKPVQPYDENKYSQRQLQMQQGKETPPLRKPSPPRVFAPRQQMGRDMGDSHGTFAPAPRSRSNSSAQKHFLPQDRTPGHAPPPFSVPEEKAPSPVKAPASPSNNSSRYEQEPEQADRTRGSMPRRDLVSMYQPDQDIPLERPPESQHPANRQRSSDSKAPDNAEQPTNTKLQPNASESSNPSVTISREPTDSPTLGPTTELTGLNGMVRQHLRTISNASSLFDDPPPTGSGSGLPQRPTESPPQTVYFVEGNPWEENGQDYGHRGNKSPIDVSKIGTKAHNTAPPPLSIRSPNVEGAGPHGLEFPRAKEAGISHTRDGSSETQKERRAFHDDLAARRRQVEEHLKSFVETESRSTSPLPGETIREGGHRTNALALLKNKTSRGSLVGRPKEPKPMRVTTNGNAMFPRSPSPGRASADGDAWNPEVNRPSRVTPNGPSISPPTKAFRQARRDAQRHKERLVALRHHQQVAAEPKAPDWSNKSFEDMHQQREPNRFPPNIRTRIRTPSRDTKPPPVASTHRGGYDRESQGSNGTNRPASRPTSRSSRDRSSSDAFGRSKSRNDRYRDDSAKSMADGPSSAGVGAYDDVDSSARSIPRSPAVIAIPPQSSPMPSPMASSDGRVRSRSNSRSAANGYFEPPKLQPVSNGDGRDIGLSPKPSPITPLSGNPTPSMPQPSPAVSAASPPTTQGFQSQTRIPTNRKRSINKHDISEPKLVSSTSRITTVDLPPGASLQNGAEPPPPIPPVNPRRKTRAMFGFGKRDEHDEYFLPTAAQSTDEMSTFSDDGEPKPRVRQKLRKSSSEGGNLNARARQAIAAAPSPAMPELTPNKGDGTPTGVEGGMF